MILSSRNIFKLEVNNSNYNDFDRMEGFYFNDVHKYNCCINCTKLNEENNDTHIYRSSICNYWHWPMFIKTKLGEYVIRNNLKLGASYHEGLIFDYDTCISINNILSKNPIISNDLFNYPACIEEFALQTLCCLSNKDISDFRPLTRLSLLLNTFSITSSPVFGLIFLLNNTCS